MESPASNDIRACVDLLLLSRIEQDSSTVLPSGVGPTSVVWGRLNNIRSFSLELALSGFTPSHATSWSCVVSFIFYTGVTGQE